MAGKKTAVPPAHTPQISAARALARLQRLHTQVSDVRAQGHNATLATSWPRDIEGVLSDFYGPASVKFNQFHGIRFGPFMSYPGQPTSEYVEAFEDGVNNAEAFLRSRIEELQEDVEDIQVAETIPTIQAVHQDNRKVFIVHGHDNGTKETVARFITKLALEPIILHEQASEGRTIVEKFEHYADVGCAVVLLTSDDTGSSKATPSKIEERARQNVVFELDFFVGKLSRKHTIALIQKGVSKPSDIDGVVYISLDDESWKLVLVRELKAAGMHVDANKAFE